VQKQYIAQHLALFEQAGISPTTITVDVFALYALYTQIPAYIALTDVVILLDLDMHITRIIAIDQHQLRIIRTLPYGLASIAKEAGNSAQMKAADALDQLVRFGPTGDTKSGSNQALNSSLGAYFNKVQFALSSTTGSLQNKNITKILLTGPGAEIKDILSFAQNILQLPCEIFDGQLLAQNKSYHINKNVTISPSSLFSTGIALICPPVEYFNLQKEEFEKPQTTLLLKQMIVAGILIVAIFSSLITHSIMQTRRLTKESRISRMEAIEELKNRFPEIPEEEDDLEEVLRTAKEELSKEEALWLAFSSQARASFLEYLLELSTRINKQQLGFVPEQLTIVDGVAREIMLKAQVRDFEALKQLEKALQQSKLFSYVESPKLPEFAMKINVARSI
jgi:hypothetical protein